MANTLDGDEVEAVVLLDVAGHLTLGEPWTPVFLNSPVETLDPLLRAIGWNGTISVTGVLHDTGLVTEDWVDPQRALIQLVVVDLTSAFRPGLYIIWDVECSTHISSIHVVREVVSQDWLFLMAEGVEGPRSVLRHGKTSLELTHLISNDGIASAALLADLSRRFKKRFWVSVSVQIINVQLCHQLLDLSPGLQAHWWVAGVWESWITVEFAIVCLHGVEKALWNDVKVVQSLWQGWVSVHIPVSATIANHHTLDVDSFFAFILGSLVMLVNLPGKVWNIDTGIRFT